MCEDLIFVTAYCPTQEQLNRLSECCDLLKIEGFDLAVISHTTIPSEIQNKCNWSIYDSNNELVDDIDLKHYERHYGPNWSIVTKLLNKTPFYGLAIYRMFSIVSKLAETFGYKRIYHVEYDYLVKDNSIFKNHKEFLKTYDSVFYTLSYDNNMILGGLKSFRVDKLPEIFRNYDKDKIMQRIKSENLLPLEKFTKKIFEESGNQFFIDYTVLEKRVETKKFDSQNLNWCLAFNPENQNISLYWIKFGNEKIIDIIVDGKKNNITLEFNSGYCDLGVIDDVKTVTIIRDGLEVFDSKITDKFKEKIKLNSIVTRK